MTHFHGVYTALITPFTDDAAAPDLGRLAAQIQRQAEGGVSGIVPCGTTGETPTLSDREHEQVVTRAIEIARNTHTRTHSRRPLTVIAGAGSNCTRRAVEMHRRVHDAGADAALHVCPYYNKPSQEGLYRHFMEIADACPLPVVLYNIPGRTGVCLGLDTIVRLGRHPNIRAIKDATGGIKLADDVLRHTDLAVLSGDDPLTLPLLALGGHGVISVLSNVVPEPVVRLCAAMHRGDLDEARRLHRDLLPLAEALLTLEPNPVPVKAALAMRGRDNGVVRLPLVPARPEVCVQLERLLAAAETHQAKAGMPATAAAGRS